jgi:GT2 family glycosyltransferase
MDLSIVIVNYNSKDKTLNCLKSIFKSDLAGIDFEVILVDNNSKENIETEVNSLYPRVKIVKSKKNLGMGGGNNLGIKEAVGKYVLILNPDTMPEPDAIRKLYNYLEANGKAGIAGPKLLYPDGQLQYSCFRGWKFLTPVYRRTFLGRIAKKHLDNFLMRDFDHNSAREVDWLMGSCLMIRKSILDKIKTSPPPSPCATAKASGDTRSQGEGEYFDERFFMYFEDTDLCRRVRRAEYKVVYFPEAAVVHDHVRASAKKPWYLAPFLSKLSRTHIASWIKYFIKWH